MELEGYKIPAVGSTLELKRDVETISGTFEEGQTVTVTGVRKPYAGLVYTRSGGDNVKLFLEVTTDIDFGQTELMFADWEWEETFGDAILDLEEN